MNLLRVQILLGNWNVREIMLITFFVFNKFISREKSKKENQQERVINYLGFIQKVMLELGFVGYRGVLVVVNSIYKSAEERSSIVRLGKREVLVLLEYNRGYWEQWEMQQENIVLVLGFIRGRFLGWGVEIFKKEIFSFLFFTMLFFR